MHTCTNKDALVLNTVMFMILFNFPNYSNVNRFNYSRWQKHFVKDVEAHGATVSSTSGVGRAYHAQTTCPVVYSGKTHSLLTDISATIHGNSRGLFSAAFALH